jgi:hypothetical protein
MAGFFLEHTEGATLTSTRYLDPRTALSFATEGEAKDRNRALALNWRNANCPDAELFERRAE